ncbi:hypothetical protein PAPYR_2193 [Paratrimastix pyriformis]|uniref:Uncharacterized protein n=1 Tax=Paratrimastix pyriformis TaxID=342808 RepID=A0ABQ8UR17_9EUKA|nr:hypothetical protein PAPYR_2193 [Paratrimastix pyriformis]
MVFWERLRLIMRVLWTGNVGEQQIRWTEVILRFALYTLASLYMFSYVVGTGQALAYSSWINGNFVETKCQLVTYQNISLTYPADSYSTGACVHVFTVTFPQSPYVGSNAGSSVAANVYSLAQTVKEYLPSPSLRRADIPNPHVLARSVSPRLLDRVALTAAAEMAAAASNDEVPVYPGQVLDVTIGLCTPTSRAKSRWRGLTPETAANRTCFYDPKAPSENMVLQLPPDMTFVGIVMIILVALLPSLFWGFSLLWVGNLLYRQYRIQQGDVLPGGLFGAGPGGAMPVPPADGPAPPPAPADADGGVMGPGQALGAARPAPGARRPEAEAEPEVLPAPLPDDHPISPEEEVRLFLDWEREALLRGERLPQGGPAFQSGAAGPAPPALASATAPAVATATALPPPPPPPPPYDTASPTQEGAAPPTDTIPSDYVRRARIKFTTAQFKQLQQRFQGAAGTDDERRES